MKTSYKIFLLVAIVLFFVILGYFLINKYFFKTYSEKKDYACHIEHKRRKYASFEGEKIKIHLRIKNEGRVGWSSKGKNPCLLSYHLLNEKEKIIRYDNRRFPLPQKINPGQSFETTISIISPLQKGKYILEFDLLKEGIAWFKDYGSRTSKFSLWVKEKKWPEDKYDLNLYYGKYTKFNSSIVELNKIRKLIRVTLNQNEMEFNGKTGKVCGFSAGENYPQIWLRDANATIPASRYFYDRAYLYSWLGEHLSFQKDDGSLEDWIDPRGKFDKNTTETDQEASAVQASYQIFELLGPQWLEKSIKGEKIIQRLEHSLNFIFSHRFYKKFGLLQGAHTADWGDLDIVDQDQKAIYVDKQTHWTADIYDQSMIYEACLNLSQMFETLGQKQKALLWKNKADKIKKNTNKWLWQEDKGFYRIHIHLDSWQHNFDEDNIFATGGNTQAILSGLAGEERSCKIIQEALKRQKYFKISTISGTLLPPYPKNFFKHPLVDEPYEYQNGGQWDWFGGKLIYAMFENGFSHLAKEKLIEILKKNLANKSFFEWDSKDGFGQGSDFYCASAGSLSKAIFEGYFGVKLRRNYLNLEPKLGRDSAKIHIYLPANDIFVAYDYIFNKNQDKITMQINSNYPCRGKVKVLSPWLQSKKKEKTLKSSLMVQIDGKKANFYLDRQNNDEFIVINTNFKKHLLEIRKRK